MVYQTRRNASVSDRISKQPAQFEHIFRVAPGRIWEVTLGAYRQFGILCGAIALVSAPTAASAHPHVWATVRSEIVLGPNHQITAIRHAWTFDEFYTAMAIEGLDTNKDGVYSKEELEPLAKVNVESLKEFDDFTYVHFDGEDDKLIKLKPPVELLDRLRQERAHAPLHLAAGEAGRYARQAGCDRCLRSFLLRCFWLCHREAHHACGCGYQKLRSQDHCS